MIWPMIYCTEGKHANHYINNIIHTILKNMQLLTSNFFLIHTITNNSFCHNFFHLLAWKPNLEKFSIYSNKFFHKFHLSWASGKWVSAKTKNIWKRFYVSILLVLAHTVRSWFVLFKRIDNLTMNYRSV
jgi:hypothetical protein